MAQLVGIFRLGGDAELRYTQGGEAVASMALAYDHGQKGGDGRRPSQWITASLWGKRAEAMAQHLTKGKTIYCVINDPHVETYQKRDGGDGFKLVGRIAEVEFAGGPREAQSGDLNAPAQPRQPRQAPAPASSFDDLGDSIPFISCSAFHDEQPSLARRLAKYERN